MQINAEEKGRASLEVSLVFNQSTVTAAYASSPMKLLTPRSCGPSVCAFVSNFGGGLVAGDQTRLDLRIGNGARCFVGTQASTKIYRNPSLLPCEHATHATLDAGAVLVFAPAPVQPFAHSSYVQRQKFHLASGAGLVLLDWVTSGRKACGERWAFAHFESRNEVWQCFQPAENSQAAPSPEQVQPAPASPQQCVFIDSLRLDPNDGALTSNHRTGRFNCFAMLLLFGEPFEKHALRLLKETNNLPVNRRAPLLVSASPIKCGAVLRVAGEELAHIENYLRGYLKVLSAPLGEDPWSRRW